MKIAMKIYAVLMAIMIADSVVRGGVLFLLMFGVVCLVFLAFVLAWETVERAIKRRKGIL